MKKLSFTCETFISCSNLKQQNLFIKNTSSTCEKEIIDKLSSKIIAE